MEVRTEREARELKGTAKIVQALEPEMQQAVTQYLKSDAGAEVPYAALTGKQRSATLAENIITGTHERMLRQKMHHQEGMLDAKSNGRGGWTD